MENDNVVVTLPDDGVIDTAWAMKELEKATLFSTFDLNANKGRVFFMLKSHLPTLGYEQSVQELDYTIETAETYINFLGKLPILEAIRTKYMAALSLSASELLPDTLEDAMALLDICIARIGRPTAKNLAKALELTGATPKKLTSAALTVEVLKKKAFMDWLLDEHGLSEDDVYMASKVDTTGRTEFTEKMAQAFFLLEDWSIFYDTVATAVHAADDSKALRFLADINDAAVSIGSFLESEKAFNSLNSLRAEFNNEVYPELSFQAEQREL